MRLRVLPLLVTGVAAVAALGVVPAAAAPARAIPSDSAYGTYFPNAPQRVLDTRTGGNSALGQGRSVVVKAVSTNGVVPNAVVVNLTAVAPTTTGYLTAYPAGQPLPRTSSINFTGGRTTANLVTVPVAGNGTYVVYNGLGTTDVIVDQLGVYTGATTTPAGRGGGFHPLDEPQRVLDTRSDGGGQLGGGFYLTVPVQVAGTDSSTQVAALAVNITVTNTRSAGYVTAWDGATNQPPRVSTLNYVAGQTVANAAIVPTSQCGPPTCTTPAAQIGIVNGGGGAIDLVVDVVGYFDDGSVDAPVRFQPLTSPVRIVDSRTRVGMAPVGPGATSSFTAPEMVNGQLFADDLTVGLDANVTLVRPTAPTYLTLWPKFDEPIARPRTSTVNSPTGGVVSNHVIQELGSFTPTPSQPSVTTKPVNIFNYNGTSNVVVDVSGRFRYIATDAGKAGRTSAQLTALPATRAHAAR
ncbi:hypothetical protein ACXR2U_16735 [Jatrophihabitans sp. YIM 134969]